MSKCSTDSSRTFFGQFQKKSVLCPRSVHGNFHGQFLDISMDRFKVMDTSWTSKKRPFLLGREPHALEVVTTHEEPCMQGADMQCALCYCVKAKEQ